MPELKIEKVKGFRDEECPDEIHLTAAQLNCPKRILEAFQQIMQSSPLLGTYYQTPYSRLYPRFPLNADELTARHLQIIARNESANTSGFMKTSLYNGLLTELEISQIRCLVKSTTVAGITYAKSTGGYPQGNPVKPLDKPIKTIVIDQSGLQWQQDLTNTGGLFFYPNTPEDLTKYNYSPEDYTQWQRGMYKAMLGGERPEVCSDHYINVTWNGIAGKVDLAGVERAIEAEFSQALDAAVVRKDLPNKDYLLVHVVQPNLTQN